MLCFIAQGSKDVLLQQEIFSYVPSQFLAVSVDLPVIGRVTIDFRAETHQGGDGNRRRVGLAVPRGQLHELAKDAGAGVKGEYRPFFDSNVFWFWLWRI